MPGKLVAYQKKRNFNKTTEPQGGESGEKLRKEPAFVVQKHAATHLHYDFRLAMGGVLKSWAVPKGISLDPKDKHLAVSVEDHPLSYQNFAGVIPEGEYGAGKVAIWDHGTYKNLRSVSMAQAFSEGKIVIALSGKKLHGNFVLIRFKGKTAAASKANKNWLLMHMKGEPHAESKK